MEIPTRVTQRWIEQTVPSLTQADLDQLLSVLRQRNWTDHDLAERVLPHARFGAEGVAEALPHTVTEGATTSVALVCPRGHTQQTEVAVDGAIIKTR